MIKKCLEKHEEVSVDRVHFSSFGDSALMFEVVYHVLKPEYGLYMDIQQSVNLELVKLFEAAGIGIAFPTQKLFVELEAGVIPG